MWPWFDGSRVKEETISMNKWHKFVNKFYKRGGFPEAKFPGAEISEKEAELSLLLIKEEVNKELLDVMERVGSREMTDEELAEFIDAVVDSIWVILDAATRRGVTSIDPFFTEVARSNLAKIPPGGPIKHPETGKIQKPEGWTPPDIIGLVRKLFRRKP